MLKLRSKEDEVLVQIAGLIGYLEEKRERIERGEAGPNEVAELTKKVEGAWQVLCRRAKERG